MKSEMDEALMLVGVALYVLFLFWLRLVFDLYESASWGCI